MQSFFLAKMNIFLLRCESKFASRPDDRDAFDNPVDKQWISVGQVLDNTLRGKACARKEAKNQQRRGRSNYSDWGKRSLLLVC
jgi:hypothetical protein